MSMFVRCSMYVLMSRAPQKVCVRGSVQVCGACEVPTSQTHCFDDCVQGCFQTKVLPFMPIFYTFQTSKTQFRQNMRRKFSNGPPVSNVACTCRYNVFLDCQTCILKTPWLCVCAIMWDPCSLCQPWCQSCVGKSRGYSPAARSAQLDEIAPALCSPPCACL